MSDAVLVAIIGLLGSGIGSLVGALVSNKVWQYRIEQLEKKVEGLGRFMEKTYRLEEEHNLFEEKFKVMNHRITDLERRTQ
ncbi:MAG: hypothetical protein J6Q74_00665 [Clostridia bacterium]|nr:hypothetical protein [Clostridia bacterium]